MIVKRWIKFLNILSAFIAAIIPSAVDAFLIETQRMIRIEKTLGALKKTEFLVWTTPIRIDPIFGLITGKSAHELSSCKHPITLAVISLDGNRGGIYPKEGMDSESIGLSDECPYSFQHAL
ncbi:hypothetical protein BJP41_04420 [Candidatus Williamhamiltonella defendens]|uniref:Uncharacterized protein n=1 Tax=Candidatus Williamhamiltonella defendens TaxID=138072 RepID=A0A2D3T1P0_9ENTR|nr:hypothetical protein [Candidatus Hamiltonella defensa]ATW29710.1 hypothetical protein BJP41_04420 [Candidatus Hamiltonella defensa]